MVIKIARAVALVIGCAGITYMPDTRIQREVAFLCVTETRCANGHEAHVSFLGEAAGSVFAALSHPR
jgi:hypothetical protein